MAERGVFVRDSYSGVSCGKAGTADAMVMRRRALHADAEGVVVILHGLGDAPISWFRALRSALPKQRILLPALPGAGRGPLPEGRDHVTHEEARAWLADLLGRILETTDLPVRLVGHSLGGWLMSALLLEHPAIAARTGPHILVNSAGTWYEGVERERAVLTPDSYEDVDELLGLLYAEEPDLPIEAIDAMLRTMRSPAYRKLLQSTEERHFLRAADLARLPPGVGVVWGVEDRLVPPEACDILTSSLRSPRVVRLEGVGHAPHTEAPARCAAAIEELLGAPVTERAVAGATGDGRDPSTSF